MTTAITNVSKADYVDALNEYYAYKHQYDEKFEEDKNAVKNSDLLTMSQKRAKIARIKRNRKCVSGSKRRNPFHERGRLPARAMREPDAAVFAAD